MNEIKNKYSKWYYNLVESRSKLDRKKHQGIYYESHHIVPKSLGGSNDSHNLVLLTAREHLVAHLLLTRFTFGKSRHKMIKAIVMMYGKNTSSRLYEALRLEHSKSMSGSNNPMYGKPSAMKNKKHSEKTRAKISAGLYKNPPNKGKTLSKDHRNKISESVTGIKSSRFKGFYITPNGKYPSSSEAARSICSVLSNKTLISWCKDSDKIILKLGNSRYLKNLGSDIVGKTFKELGFDYVNF